MRLSPDRGAPSVCASVSYRGDCPSTNGMPPVTRRVGDLTFCLGARCDARACCPSGTVCEYRSDLQATSCGADTPSPNLDCADSGVDSGVDAMAPPDAAPDASMDVSAD